MKLTHPDRLYWPDAGVTKEGLADYYSDAWPRMAPFIVGRALAVLRCPDGITGQMFFQKHIWKGAAAGIATLRDPREPGETLIGVSDLDGLLALAQGAALEIHPWGSTAEDWERPDILVMDLDPGDGRRVGAGHRRGARDPRKIAARRALRIRQDLRRQGASCRRAVAAASRMARGQGLRQGDGRFHGRGQPGPVRIDRDQGAARRQNFHRLSAKPARRDGRSRLTAPARVRARLFRCRSSGTNLSAAIGPAHFTIANAPKRLSLPGRGSLGRTSRGSATPRPDAEPQEVGAIIVTSEAGPRRAGFDAARPSC